MSDPRMALAVALRALNEIKADNRCECGDAAFEDADGKTQLCHMIAEDGTPSYCPRCTAKTALAEVRELQKSGAV